MNEGLLNATSLFIYIYDESFLSKGLLVECVFIICFFGRRKLRFLNSFDVSINNFTAF